MPKNITTKLTIENLTAELKSTFAKKSHLPTKVSDLTNDSNFQTETQVDNKISAALVGALKPSGSIAFAELPALAAGVLNNMYNISDAFTTTADFVEGAGKDYPAGTNVAVINVGTDESPVYKYDAYTGTFDFSGFAEKVSGATAGHVAGLDANGNLTDSGVAAADIQQKVTSATSGNVATFNSNGFVQDGGVAASEIVTKVYVEGVEDAVIHESDISDYTAAEIAAMLADD